MMTSPPFMSMMPGPRASCPTAARSAGTGGRLEHGVEVADQQEVRPAPTVFRDQVPGAIERRAVHPSRAEAERVELRPKPVAHRAYAREVRRAAVDVHDGSSRADRGVASRDRRRRRCVVRWDRAERRASACTAITAHASTVITCRTGWGILLVGRSLRPVSRSDARSFRSLGVAHSSAIMVRPHFTIPHFTIVC